METTYKKLESNIFKKYPNGVFVETGTYIGDSVQYAIEAGFSRIISIELSEKYYQLSKERFKNNDNVTIIHGDSGSCLWDAIKDIDEPITFWLDGHFSKGDTAIGDFCSPIMLELSHIAAHPIRTHTILIDDMKSWENKGEFVCNCPLYPCHKIYGFYADDIISAVSEINSYDFSYEFHAKENNILVCTIK